MFLVFDGNWILFCYYLAEGFTLCNLSCVPLRSVIMMRVDLRLVLTSEGASGYVVSIVCSSFSFIDDRTDTSCGSTY